MTTKTRKQPFTWGYFRIKGEVFVEILCEYGEVFRKARHVRCSKMIQHDFLEE